MSPGGARPGRTSRGRALATPSAVLVVVLGAAIGPSAARGETKPAAERQWSLSGDFRLRAEQDWDSRNAAGDPREDRLRARIRARLSFAYRPADFLSFGLRLRSGSDGSQQSPHVTVLDFDGNGTGDADFNFDKAFLRAKGGGFEAWAGRNGLPIWKANELLWDDDVTAAGVGLGYAVVVGERGRLALNGGYFSLPAGMRALSGNLGLGQVVLTAETAGGTGFTLAGGAFFVDADPDDPAASLLRQGNGGRDYRIWVGNAQVRTRLGGWPLALGGDVMVNSEDYRTDDPDSFTAAHRDDTAGFDAYVKWGGTAKKGDWLFGLWYARIEALAVVASYAQDDWVRWGSATQTDSSDLEGFELRAAVGLGHGQNVVARLYLVEALSSVQDGNRFRIDYNVGF